jgi:flavorubredoxin
MSSDLMVKNNADVDRVKGEVLYDKDGHKFIWLGWEEQEEEGTVQVNQYLIIDKGEGILLDPGGIHVFPQVVGNVSRYIDLDNIKHIFFAHQDPDVCSGISLWLGVTPAKIHISKWWVRFLPHFGVYDVKKVSPIEDRGGYLSLPSGSRLDFVPAHFLHSIGNFSLYDNKSKILFTGDLGAAIFPHNKRYLFVDDFNSHIKLMDAFHKRFMVSNIALKAYLKQLYKYNIEMICPQHGAIFPDKETAKKFLNWLNNLKCGIDLINSIYR